MSTTHHEFETTDIPLKKLLAWNENVRTTSAEQGIDELAASIASVGLLQLLVVRKAPRGKFSVIAGKRRLQVLSQLVEAGTVKPTFPVPCRIVLREQPGVISAALTSKVPLSLSTVGLSIKQNAVSTPLKQDIATELHYTATAISLRCGFR